MPTYAIGDVQGCYQSLKCLLEKINFDEKEDELWFAGDLVNRGPDSLATLRFIKSLNARVVLGNHDLHLLACFYSDKQSPRRKDTLDDILQAPDVEELMQWLRQQPLMIWDKRRDTVLTHAGIPHIWSVKKALALAKEVHEVLQGPNYSAYFAVMYGNQPDVWSDELTGMERLRVITNYFTRMRFISEQGRLEFAAKESMSKAPEGYAPWFDFQRKDKTRFLFGHWAALEGKTRQKHALALDTGCVWGNRLRAMNIDSGHYEDCDCAHEQF